VVVETIAVPAGARMSATAQRPLGVRAETPLTFVAQGKGRWVSQESLAQGRWQMRLAIRAGDQAWAGEAQLP
jgi:nitrogen fixation protein FixH